MIVWWASVLLPFLTVADYLLKRALGHVTENQTWQPGTGVCHFWSDEETLFCISVMKT